MSDEQDKPGAMPADDEPQAPIAGERLAEARRAQQIPVVDIAKELHLDEYKVHALERNDFDVIGAPVFAKGHLRKYAQLVQVSEADVMADYYQLNRANGTPPVISVRPKLRKEISPGPWVAAILALALIAAAYWWFGIREIPSVSRTTGEVAPLPQIENNDDTQAQPSLGDDATSAGELDDVSDVAQSTEQPTEQPIEQLPSIEPRAAAVTTAVADNDTGELRVTVIYSGDSWTEITDAGGRRLFFDLGSAGRTVNLSGEAPFNVLFGNAANVSLQVNGASFEIPAVSLRGRTARLTIDGQ